MLSCTSYTQARQFCKDADNYLDRGELKEAFGLYSSADNFISSEMSILWHSVCETFEAGWDLVSWFSPISVQRKFDYQAPIYGKAIALKEMGDKKKSQGEQKEANKYYQQSIEVFERLNKGGGNVRYIFKEYHQARLYFLLGDYKSAFKYYNEAIKLWKNELPSITYLEILCYQAFILYSDNVAENRYEKTLALCDEVIKADEKYVALAYGIKANIYLVQKKFEAAEKCFDEAWKQYDRSLGHSEFVNFNRCNPRFLPPENNIGKRYAKVEHHLGKEQYQEAKQELARSTLCVPERYSEITYQQMKDRYSEILKIITESENRELKEGENPVEYANNQYKLYKFLSIQKISGKAFVFSIHYACTYLLNAYWLKNNDAKNEIQSSDLDKISPLTGKDAAIIKEVAARLEKIPQDDPNYFYARQILFEIYYYSNRFHITYLDFISRLEDIAKAFTCLLESCATEEAAKNNPFVKHFKLQSVISFKGNKPVWDYGVLYQHGWLALGSELSGIENATPLLDLDYCIHQAANFTPFKRYACLYRILSQQDIDLLINKCSSIHLDLLEEKHKSNSAKRKIPAQIAELSTARASFINVNVKMIPCANEAGSYKLNILDTVFKNRKNIFCFINESNCEVARIEKSNDQWMVHGYDNNIQLNFCGIQSPARLIIVNPKGEVSISTAFQNDMSIQFVHAKCSKITFFATIKIKLADIQAECTVEEVSTISVEQIEITNASTLIKGTINSLKAKISSNHSIVIGEKGKVNNASLLVAETSVLTVDGEINGEESLVLQARSIYGNKNSKISAKLLQVTTDDLITDDNAVIVIKPNGKAAIKAKKIIIAKNSEWGGEKPVITNQVGNEDAPIWEIAADNLFELNGKLAAKKAFIHATEFIKDGIIVALSQVTVGGNQGWDNGEYQYINGKLSITINFNDFYFWKMTCLSNLVNLPNLLKELKETVSNITDQVVLKPTYESFTIVAPLSFFRPGTTIRTKKFTHLSLVEAGQKTVESNSNIDVSLLRLSIDLHAPNLMGLCLNVKSMVERIYCDGILSATSHVSEKITRENVIWTLTWLLKQLFPQSNNIVNMLNSSYYLLWENGPRFKNHWNLLEEKSRRGEKIHRFECLYLMQHFSSIVNQASFLPLEEILLIKHGLPSIQAPSINPLASLLNIPTLFMPCSTETHLFNFGVSLAVYTSFNERSLFNYTAGGLVAYNSSKMDLFTDQQYCWDVAVNASYQGYDLQLGNIHAFNLFADALHLHISRYISAHSGHFQSLALSPEEIVRIHSPSVSLSLSHVQDIELLIHSEKEYKDFEPPKRLEITARKDPINLTRPIKYPDRELVLSGKSAQVNAEVELSQFSLYGDSGIDVNANIVANVVLLNSFFGNIVNNASKILGRSYVGVFAPKGTVFNQSKVSYFTGKDGQTHMTVIYAIILGGTGDNYKKLGLEIRGMKINNDGILQAGGDASFSGIINTGGNFHTYNKYTYHSTWLGLGEEVTVETILESFVATMGSLNGNAYYAGPSLTSKGTIFSAAKGSHLGCKHVELLGHLYQYKKENDSDVFGLFDSSHTLEAQKLIADVLVDNEISSIGIAGGTTFVPGLLALGNGDLSFNGDVNTISCWVLNVKETFSGWGVNFLLADYLKSGVPLETLSPFLSSLEALQKSFNPINLATAGVDGANSYQWMKDAFNAPREVLSQSLLSFFLNTLKVSLSYTKSESHYQTLAQTGIYRHSLYLNGDTYLSNGVPVHVENAVVNGNLHQSGALLLADHSTTTLTFSVGVSDKLSLDFGMGYSGAQTKSAVVVPEVIYTKVFTMNGKLLEQHNGIVYTDILMGHVAEIRSEDKQSDVSGHRFGIQASTSGSMSLNLSERHTAFTAQSGIVSTDHTHFTAETTQRAEAKHNIDEHTSFSLQAALPDHSSTKHQMFQTPLAIDYQTPSTLIHSKLPIYNQGGALPPTEHPVIEKASTNEHKKVDHAQYLDKKAELAAAAQTFRELLIEQKSQPSIEQHGQPVFDFFLNLLPISIAYAETKSSKKPAPSDNYIVLDYMTKTSAGVGKGLVDIVKTPLFLIFDLAILSMEKLKQDLHNEQLSQNIDELVDPATYRHSAQRMEKREDNIMHLLNTAGGVMLSAGFVGTQTFVSNKYRFHPNIKYENNVKEMWRSLLDPIMDSEGPNRAEAISYTVTSLFGLPFLFKVGNITLNYHRFRMFENPPLYHSTILEGSEEYVKPQTINLISLEEIRGKSGAFDLIYAVDSDGNLKISRAYRLFSTGAQYDALYEPSFGFADYSNDIVDITQGKPVMTAGQIETMDGRIKKIDNHSLDYQSEGEYLKNFVERVFNRHGFFEAQGKFVYYDQQKERMEILSPLSESDRIMAEQSDSANTSFPQVQEVKSQMLPWYVAGGLNRVLSEDEPFISESQRAAYHHVVNEMITWSSFFYKAGNRILTDNAIKAQGYVAGVEHRSEDISYLSDQQKAIYYEGQNMAKADAKSLNAYLLTP